MNKKMLIIKIIVLINMICIPANAQVNYPPKQPTAKELKQLDENIAKRLNLTDEQIKTLRINRTKNLKIMENTIKQMEDLRQKIYNVYILGIPKYQADFRTAHMKMELAILKQKADKIRYENRKNFENILTPEQKLEFEVMKKEFSKKY